MNNRIKKNENLGVLPVIGKIKIGELKVSQNGKSYPSSIDYFRCDANASYVELYTGFFGEKPITLPIVFPSNDTNDFLSHLYELRDSAGKMYAKSDGQSIAVATKSNADGAVYFHEYSAQELKKQFGGLDAAMTLLREKSGGTAWRERLSLKFIILRLPILGLFQFDTSGDDTTIPQLIKVIDTVQESAGRIMFIPFDLCLKIAKSDKSGDTRKYPVVSLVCNLSPESIELLNAYTGDITGLVNSEKIQTLTTGQSDQNSMLNPGIEEDVLLSDDVYADYEEIALQTEADQFIAHFTINTVQDLNDCLLSIRKAEFKELDTISTLREFIAEKAKALNCIYHSDSQSFKLKT